MLSNLKFERRSLANHRIFDKKDYRSVISSFQMQVYGYGIPPFYECYLRHGPCLIGVDTPIYHKKSSNYTSDMLRCYLASENYLWLTGKLFYQISYGLPSSSVQILNLMAKNIYLRVNFIFTIKYFYLHVNFLSNILWFAKLLRSNFKFNVKNTFVMSKFLYLQSTKHYLL